MHPPLEYLAAIAVSAVLARWVAIPFSIRLAHLVGAIDHPGALKVHSQPIPRLGGVGILLAVLLVYAALCIAYPPYADMSAYLAYGVAALVGVVGMVDDMRDLPTTVKFPTEALIVIIFMWVARDSLNPWLCAALGLWFLAMVNGYNFLDGLDGLAGGVAAINFAGLSAVFVLGDALSLGLLSLAGAGACVGFLFLNWAPAKVFLGDVGALGIGALAAGMSTVYLATDGATYSRVVAVGLVCAVPVSDVAFTVVRRIASRRTLVPSKLFRGDRFHFYDQMVAQNAMEPQHAVIITHVVAAAITALGIVAHFLTGWPLVMIAAAAAAVMIVTGKRYRIRLVYDEEKDQSA